MVRHFMAGGRRFASAYHPQIDARNLTFEIGGRWYGCYGTAPCPVCQIERRKDQNALTLAEGRDGRLLLHCKKSGCDFGQVLDVAGVSPTDAISPAAASTFGYDPREQEKAVRRERQATRLWNEAVPIENTGAEVYLRKRGITCPLPETLRFHPECWHPSARRIPALVALVEGGERIAVHRTYLDRDGSGKADVEPSKAMLGAVAGGAIRLAEGSGTMVIAEGIETALSLASGLLREPADIWAALSTSGVRRLHLPSRPGRLVIAPDGDAPGYAAAHALAERADALGWAVSLLPAPEGRDWNDVLIERAAE